MATLRCTTKYRKAFGLPESLPEPIPSDSLLGEWYGNIFSIARQQFVHYLCERVLLSVIVPLRQRKLAEERMLESLGGLLHSFGASDHAVGKIVSEVRPFAYARARNRSTLASMRDQAIVARNAVFGRRASSTFEIMLDLAEMPVGALGFNYPRRATLELLASSDAG
jgi:hypothetical protein